MTLDEFKRAVRRHLALGQVDIAADLLLALERQAPDHPVAHHFVGKILLRQGNHLGAMSRLCRALARDSGNREILEDLLSLSRVIGDQSGIRSYEQALAALPAAPRAVVFGDSHALHCFGRVDWCERHWLGPRTMHRVGREGLDGIDPRAYYLPQRADVVMVFGEIDARAHIGRQRDERGRDQDEVIGDLVANYIDAVCAIRLLGPAGAYVVCGVVPPGEYEMNPEFPTYGSLQDRARITASLNGALQKAADAVGLLYLDLYTPFVQEDGTFDPAFTDDNVHVREDLSPYCGAMLKRLLRRHSP